MRADGGDTRRLDADGYANGHDRDEAQGGEECRVASALMREYLKELTFS